jgi:hypothetical protein
LLYQKSRKASVYAGSRTPGAGAIHNRVVFITLHYSQMEFSGKQQHPSQYRSKRWSTFLENVQAKFDPKSLVFLNRNDWLHCAGFDGGHHLQFSWLICKPMEDVLPEKSDEVLQLSIKPTGGLALVVAFEC